MQTVRCRHRPRTRLGILFSLFFIILSSSLWFSSFCSDLICVWSLLCGGSLSSMEMEGVLSSGIVERLCTRIESDTREVDLVPTLLVLDRLCSGLKQMISSSSQPRESHGTTNKGKDDQHEPFAMSDRFSLVQRCGFALTRIEQAVVTFGRSLEKVECDEQVRVLQEKVGGMILRHFSSSITSTSPKEIGALGIDLAAVRREMDDRMKHIEKDRDILREEREKERREIKIRENEREISAKKAEEERQREFSRKMKEIEAEREKEKRELEEMRRVNERLIEKGRQQEEKKREEEKKRKEYEERMRKEEERRRNVKEGVAAIEVFQQDKVALEGNVFRKTANGNYHLLSHSFGVVVVRITFIIRGVSGSWSFGVISTDLTEQAKTAQDWFLEMKGGAGWDCHSIYHYSMQNNKGSHSGSACKLGAVGQRVVLEADGREGKRTLKLSQDRETQPVFFSNIPVPFRFVVDPYNRGDSVEIVSSEVLREASMVGGSLEVKMD
ncbi:hypothetical protein BLNAU_6062 [Blattamonas nauphoetae]|uniref:Uncharacterized protein n=1 Tax=Blattamonas nauphoetae TaxID=2049346 RepID=A0ABQ9Y5N0_9EUKA|nr:hypothetical protein BLNAU_6062 [Blattamonas nauphoetae]